MPVAPESALTAGRTEHKYVLDRSHAAALRSRLNERLQAHHHASGSPLAAVVHHYATTVYFDTAGRDVFRAAVGARPHSKLRAREYYDVVPLDELATTTRQLLRKSPVLWLELKGRNGLWTGKRRLSVERRALRAFLSNPSRGADGVNEVASAAELLAIREELARFRSPLAPSCIVNYRRSAWQSSDCGLRVTLDQDLAAYAVDEPLWNSAKPLTRQTLGAPVARHPQMVVEVKRLDRFPTWLVGALEGLDAQPTAISKFVFASEVVHGATSGSPAA